MIARRLGILGGTFDPPHLGHEAMARLALETLGLENVLFVPAVTPPHKSSGRVTDYAHRRRMTEIAAARVESARMEPLEEQLAQPTYTVDLLRSLRDAGGEDIYFIMGADSLRDLPAWRDPGTVLSLATIVVFARDGVVPVLDVPGDASLIVFETPVGDVSSTMLRDLLANGSPVPDGTLAPEVQAYIRDEHLYT